MYMKVFPHGQGAGEGPTNYLVREDYPGRDAHLPDVLRGDPEVTRALIDSLETKWRFTAGALSWHPDDTVTPEQEPRVMDDFEALAFAGYAIHYAALPEVARRRMKATRQATFIDFTDCAFTLPPAR